MKLVGRERFRNRLCGKHAQSVGVAQFRVLQVARVLADEINKLLGNRQLRLIHRSQLRDSAHSYLHGHQLGRRSQRFQSKVLVPV